MYHLFIHIHFTEHVLLFLDRKLGFLEEVVLHPELDAVHDERDDKHHEYEFERVCTGERAENRLLSGLKA